MSNSSRKRKLTGQGWCDYFNITILDDLSKGFNSLAYFSTIEMDKFEFFQRASLCQLKPESGTRSEIGRFKEFLAM